MGELPVINPGPILIMGLLCFLWWMDEREKQILNAMGQKIHPWIFTRGYLIG